MELVQIVIILVFIVFILLISLLVMGKKLKKRPFIFTLFESKGGAGHGF